MATADVYIQKLSGTTYQIDLAPVNTIEDTYLKTPDVTNVATDPDDGEEPVTVIMDTKETSHKFTINGTLKVTAADNTNGIWIMKGSDPAVFTISAKYDRIRLLYGYYNQTDTRLTFHYDGQDWTVFMFRFTSTKHAAESTYDLIIELTEGINYDDW